MLIVMVGLPGSGKSSVAETVARMLPASIVSVDPIEAAMLRAGVDRREPTGLAAYFVAESVADGIMALGLDVIVDAVNAVEPAREQWRALAARRRSSMAVIEVVCPDQVVHRRRLEGRSRGLEGFTEPTWEAVQRLRDEYEPWADPRLVLDSTAGLEANAERAVDYLAGLFA